MLRGGWSIWHLIKMAPSEKNLIAICGHMEKGTTGYDLLEGRRNFQLSDMLTRELFDVNVRCKVDSFDISAHAMHAELCNFISKIKPGLLVLIHGEESSLNSLADSVKQYAGKIIIPSNGDRIDFEHPAPPAEAERNVEVPIAQNTALVLPRTASFRVKHMKKDRYMRAEDLKSLVNKP
jgi:predicted metal-dependent RNase